MSSEARQVAAGVVTAAATAAVLALAGVVTRVPAAEKDQAALHRDLARVETRLERIETLLLERK